jgi:hypothetical protein
MNAPAAIPTTHPTTKKKTFKEHFSSGPITNTWTPRMEAGVDWHAGDIYKPSTPDCGPFRL